MASISVRFTAQAAAFLSFLSLAACGNPAGQHAPPPAEVGVIVVRERPVPLDLTYMARTAGVREVEVRARVGGILLRRQYEEGSRVKAGDLLFRIDPAQYAAEEARARAQLGVAQAQLDETRRNRDRVEPLLAKGLISRREYDQAIAAYESAEAAATAAKAALEGARLALSYTEVRAPISGLTSRERRSEGSLVSMDGDSNLLTRIVQTDPLYIQFGMPEGEAAMVREFVGKAEVRVAALTADGKRLPQTAELTFIDTAIDQASGTVQTRATLKNADQTLMPGQFLRAKIEGVTLPDTIVIPARAVLRSPMGAMVWVVGEGDKVQPRPVQVGDSWGNEVIVLSGLKPGERVIVDGVIKVQPEAVVKPVPAREEADKPSSSVTAGAQGEAATEPPQGQAAGAGGQSGRTNKD